ncbi:CAP domain-containing protein [Streptomyces torulosus]|uniref:CAP domain-containing protein n=1 Tax=Streptomyces torulosus TaxID=68276 RepID=UPI0012FEEC2B|nr:CAP domain-containing protein [Streptomyces torulosus]
MNQYDWRFCVKCRVIAFDGFMQKGACAAGGVHKGLGYNYGMAGNEVGVVESAVFQGSWRHCGKCRALFYNYYPEKGRCPADGGGHEAAGWYYGLYHGPWTPTPRNQGNWRYCGKCRALFYDYYPEKGRCPADGGGHEAAGWNYVLEHVEEDPADSMDTQERQTWSLVKDARILHGGCFGLRIDPRLAGVARAHSEDLAAHPGLWDKKTPAGYPGHYGSDGSLAEGPNGRIARAVGSPGTENVFRGRIQGTALPPTPQTAFDAWWSSSGHKANMLNCNHSTSGVGITFGQDSGGWTAYYYTQVFHP